MPMLIPIVPAMQTASADVPPAPLGDTSAWFSAAPYPADALAQRQEGQVSAMLQIDGRGRVIGCRITRSSGSSALDRQTCELAHRNARFTPATRDGVPVTGSYPLANVPWTLPR